MILTIAETRGYAAQAGFTGTALDTIVAIAQAESGLDTTAVNSKDPNGGSFGILQINGIHGLPIAVMEDPSQAFAFAFTLSAHGSNFNPWSTYTSGAYQQMAAWKESQSGIVNTTPPKNTPIQGIPWGPSNSLATWPWITTDGVHPNINNPYMSSFDTSRGLSPHYGVGIPTPLHSQITSLTSGHVINIFFGKDINPDYNYGGVVLVASVVPGHPGVQAVYYLHLDDISVKKGQTIAVGTVLGLSGGQTSGGDNPVDSKFSTGPHTDVGINNPDFAGEGGLTGDNFDPTNWLNTLIATGPPVGDQVQLATTLPLAYLQAVSNQVATGTGPVADNFVAIETRIDEALEFIPIDWNAAGSGIQWWQWILPWQWADVGQQIETNIAKILWRDVEAFTLRAMIVLIGLIIIIAVMTAMARGVTTAIIIGQQPTPTNATGVKEAAATAALAGAVIE